MILHTPKPKLFSENYETNVSGAKPSEGIENHDSNASVVTPTCFGLIIPFRRYVIVERPRRQLH